MLLAVEVVLQLQIAHIQLDQMVDMVVVDKVQDIIH
jgi:hypothetical protein